MIVVTFVGLYSIRVVLEALGVVNFGLYNLLNSIVFLTVFLNGAMSLSFQRCFASEIQKNNKRRVNLAYNTALFQMTIFAVTITIILEVIGFFLFDGRLDIPQESIPDAKIAYQFSIITIAVNIIGNVNLAYIKTNEDFYYEVIISIINSLLQLLIAYVTLQYNQGSLALYAMLMAILAVLIQISRFIFVLFKYQECRKINLKKDNDIFKELMHYNTWNSFGAIAGTLRNSGIVILINIFFGPVVNAAYAIANQVNAKLKEFSTSMLSAITPQILKSDPTSEREKVLRLSTLASKYGVLLISLPAIPLIFEMEKVLQVWLVNVPQDTIIFCRLILFFSIVNMTTVGLQTTIQVIGDIKRYQILVGGTILFTIPISLLSLLMGFPSFSVLLIMIVIEILAGAFRIIMIKNKANMLITPYLIEVVLKPILVFTPSIFALTIINLIGEPSVYRVLLSSVVSTIIILTSFFLFAVDKNERIGIIKIIRTIKNKLT